ncbi:MAG: DUF1887 domain-containing protein [Gammaproteobacteria bacterium]
MIALVGEQPAPNLLSVKELRPSVLLLLHTDRTLPVAERLQGLIQPVPILKEVNGYDLPAIRQFISTEIAQQKWCPQQLVFNLTGGTKPMSFAAFEVGREIQVEMVYLRSEGGRTILDRYSWCGSGLLLSSQAVVSVVSLDEHLRMYFGPYTSEGPRNSFERAVVAALRESSAAHEIITSVRPKNAQALEIDLVLRRNSEVLIAEIKTRGAKSGIDQLNTAAEQRSLGTYVRRVLISGQPIDTNNRDLAKSTRVEIIELNWNESEGHLSPPDKGRLLKGLWPAESGLF